MLLIMLRIGIVLLCVGGLMIELTIALPREQRRQLVRLPGRWLRKSVQAGMRAEAQAKASAQALTSSLQTSQSQSAQTEMGVIPMRASGLGPDAAA